MNWKNVKPPISFATVPAVMIVAPVGSVIPGIIEFDAKSDQFYLLKKIHRRVYVEVLGPEKVLLKILRTLHSLHPQSCTLLPL